VVQRDEMLDYAAWPRSDGAGRRLLAVVRSDPSLELYRPDVRSVLAQREMGAHTVVVREVAGQDAPEVSLAENEHVIQALAPD
jgi:hypothetical protein